MPDSYSMYCAIQPSTLAYNTGFVLTGEIGSDWAGHMGDSFYCSNSVKVTTGFDARFHYDLWTQDYYTGHWVFASHAPSYLSAAHDLNPYWMTGIDGNTDWNRGATVDIGTDFDAWFHAELPDDATHHYVLTSVNYRFTTSAVIYWEGPTNQELRTPPGTVTADTTEWVTI